MDARTHKRLALFACLLLLGCFVAQGVAFLRANNQTIDEVAYLGAGYSYLMRRDFRLMPEHPPLMKQLAALPVWLVYRLPFEPDPDRWAEAHVADVWPISLQFLYESPADAEHILLLARLPGLALGTLLVGLVGWWSYRLWGPGAALVGTALAAFEPNLLAHSCVVGTDLGVTLFSFLTLYLLWEYTERPSVILALAVGLAAGLALASKFSGIVALGLAVGIVTAWAWRAPAAAEAYRWRPTLGLLLALAVVPALVIAAVYCFEGYGTFWRGFRWLTGNQAQGRSAFFLGEYSEKGWWSYYPFAFAIKTPVGSLLLILGSLLLFRWGRPLGRRELLFLLLPAAAFFLAARMSRTNIGLRYVLPAYPFLLVLASRLATIQTRRVWVAPVLLSIPLLASVLSVLRMAPHQLAYFNELVGGPGEGHRYLSDSNIDWGQDLKSLQAYLDGEGVPMIYLAYFGLAPPERFGIRYQYLPSGDLPRLRPPPVAKLPLGTGRELVAVSVVCLHGHYYQRGQGRELYHWLNRRRPVAQPGWSIRVYDVTGDAEAHLALARVYLQAGLIDPFIGELSRVVALDSSDADTAHTLRVLLFRRHQQQLGGLLAAGPLGPLPCLAALAPSPEDSAP